MTEVHESYRVAHPRLRLPGVATQIHYWSCAASNTNKYMCWLLMSLPLPLSSFYVYLAHTTYKLFE